MAFGWGKGIQPPHALAEFLSLMKVPSGGKTLQWMPLNLLRWEHVRDIVIATPVGRRSLQLRDLVIVLH